MSARIGREMRRELERDGWYVVIAPGGHYRAVHPEVPGKVMFLSQSPSDRRSVLNARALARRLRREST